MFGCDDLIGNTTDQIPEESVRSTLDLLGRLVYGSSGLVDPVDDLVDHIGASAVIFVVQFYYIRF